MPQEGLYKSSCFLFFLILFSIINPFNVKAFPKEKVDSIARKFLENSGSSCIVIGIADHGKTTIFCYGKISKSGGSPADSNTLFEIGSLTKLFTATAAAIEVNEGKLKYSDSLSYLLHGIRAPEYEGHEIKVIDLLHHTSALPPIPDDLPERGGNFSWLNPYTSYTRQFLDSFLSGYKLKWMPGTSYAYSNLGFGLMGDILSRIEAKPYEIVIREKIWKPLNMMNSTITLNPSQQKKMASPYKQNGEQDHLWDFDALAGCGAIRSDLADMIKFLQTSMNPAEIKNTELRAAMIDCEGMTINADNGRKIGLGWHNDLLNYNRIIWHNGGTGGFRSYLGFINGKSKGVVILTNSATSVDEIAIKILKEMTVGK